MTTILKKNCTKMLRSGTHVSPCIILCYLVLGFDHTTTEALYTATRSFGQESLSTMTY
ncbi:Putative membrane protein (plasmid) [Corynebacterium glyciniphilum AJ 3170]|uniref:Putative membrane protein n=1 Tax=Corynebacterium glyciniphilum AJ 3170 TaxID=1404245 RepID=X5DYJ4_9CORY|nr:Putative membrane protein [Corynebacterium glyciniphilum AJ 3170]